MTKEKILITNKFVEERLDNFMSNFPLNPNAEFKRDCLEFDLGHRLTTPIVNDGKLQIMLAVSGAGKTRRIYEELYSRPGLFFTCKKQGNGGSRDLEICIEDCVHHKDRKYLKALVISRVMIIRWMMKNGVTAPSSLLLAQIHPDKVFGNDVFHALYCVLRAEFSYYDVGTIFDDWLIAIDEIQSSLKTDCVFTTTGKTNRPAFSVLITTFTECFGYHRIVVSGTGIKFALMKELLASTTMKSIPYDRKPSDFEPLSENRVYVFSMKALHEMFGWNEDKAHETATLISKHELFCTARARFTSFLLEKLGEGKSIDTAITDFYEVFSDQASPYFPIQDWDRKKEDPIKRIGHVTATYHSQILQALISYLQGKEAVIEASWNDDEISELITMGIGFVSNEGTCVKLVEKAIECALFELITPEIVMRALVNEIARDSNRSINGYRFELVIMARYMKECEINGEPIQVVHGTLASCLKYLNLKDQTKCIFILPDVFAGTSSTFYFIHFIKGPIWSL